MFKADLKTLKINLRINEEDNKEDKFLQSLLDGALQRVCSYIHPYEYAEEKLAWIVVAVSIRMYNKQSKEGMQKVYSVSYESDIFLDSEKEALDRFTAEERRKEEEEKGRGKIKMFDWMEYNGL